MSNLSDCDELMEGAPHFTAAEHERIKNYTPPDRNKFMPYPNKKARQTGPDAARELAEWYFWHTAKLRQMERQWG